MAALLILLWIILSEELSLEVCLTGTALAVCLYFFACKVLGYSAAADRRAVHRLFAGAAFLGYVLFEMLKAGWIVMKLIYTKGRYMEPCLVWFHTDLMSDSARAALANAITLTAGTITVSQEGDLLCVHALDRSLAEGLEYSGFQRRLERLERCA